MGQTKENIFMTMYILKLVWSWIDLIDTFHLVKSFFMMHFRKPFIIRDFPAHKKWFFLHAAWWSIDQDFRSFNLVLSLVCRLGQGN